MQFDSCAYLDAPALLDHISCGPWRPCGLSQAWEIPFCSGGHCINLSPVPQARPQACAVQGTGIPQVKLLGWKLGGSAVLPPSPSVLPLCWQSQPAGIWGASGKASPERRSLVGSVWCVVELETQSQASVCGCPRFKCE